MIKGLKGIFSGIPLIAESVKSLEFIIIV